MIRSSADWDAGNLKTKKAKKAKSKNRGNSYNGGPIKILSEADRSGVGGGGGSACAAIPDVWCGPGVGFSTDAVVGGSIDNPVESDPPRRNIPARRKIDGDKSNSNNSNQREVHLEFLRFQRDFCY